MLGRADLVPHVTVRAHDGSQASDAAIWRRRNLLIVSPSAAGTDAKAPVMRVPVLLLILATAACGSDRTTPAAPSPSPGVASVRFEFRGPTARRADLPASAAACVQGVGATHIHPSWRGFAAIALQPVPPDRYEITLPDVPVDTSVRFRINDQNWCDQNPTGAVLRNVFANSVELVQNAITPGNGDEPGYAMTVDAAGRVRQ
jgi:hypothetical protein